MESLQYVFRIAQLLVTIVVVSVAGLLMLTVLPVRGNVRVLAVLSGSMEPSIRTGSIVVVKPTEKYKTNEVITFGMPGNSKDLVTHRIVTSQAKEGSKVFLTKGDANEELDNWKIDQSAVVGKVLVSIPYLGYLSNWIKQPMGFVAVIVLPAAILIYGELVAVKNEVVKMWLSRSRKLLVFGSLFLVFGVGLLRGSTRANMQDWEVSTGNVMGVATCYENCETPTATPTPTPGDTSTLTPTPTPVVPVINEFLPQPNPEWVEFHNASASAEFLKAYWLDDDTDFISDSGSSAKFLLSSLNTTNSTYPYIEMNTFLNNPGDTVVLFRPDGTIADQHVYVGSSSGISIGRQTDGGLPWKTCTTSTQGGSNNGSC